MLGDALFDYDQDCCVTMPNGPCNRMRNGWPDGRRPGTASKDHCDEWAPTSSTSHWVTAERRVKNCLTNLGAASNRIVTRVWGREAVLPRFRRILLVTQSARSLRHHGGVTNRMWPAVERRESVGRQLLVRNGREAP